MLIKCDLLKDLLPEKDFLLSSRFSARQQWQTGWKALSTSMFVYKNMRLEAVPPHLVYIIKFSVANPTVCSNSIPVHISDISLGENRKVTQNIWKTSLNCLSL